jgi:hypothetical protein
MVSVLKQLQTNHVVKPRRPLRLRSTVIEISRSGCENFRWMEIKR